MQLQPIFYYKDQNAERQNSHTGQSAHSNNGDMKTIAAKSRLSPFKLIPVTSQIKILFLTATKINTLTTALPLAYSEREGGPLEGANAPQI